VEGDSPEGSSAEKPLAARATAQLERKLHRLEQQNAVLVAENSELRRQVKHLQLQLGREDMLIDSGRRIPAPAERS
jgi:cell division protein FtsB